MQPRRGPPPARHRDAAPLRSPGRSETCFRARRCSDFPSWSLSFDLEEELELEEEEEEEDEEGGLFVLWFFWVSKIC